MEDFSEWEKKRVQSLHDYHLMDTEPEEELNAMVRLASEVCNTPIALISLIDEKRQWFKAKVGIEGSETSRSVSFCQYAITDKNKEVYEVKDATTNKLFSDNPFVKNDPNVRFYAGAPLVTPDGYNLGTICVIDKQPRELTEQQRETLKMISKLIITYFELRRNRQELENSRNAYLQLIEKSGDIVYSTDEAGCYAYVSPASKRITGYLPEELLGKHYLTLVEPEWKERLRDFYYQQSKENIDETVFEFPIITKQGSISWVEQTGVFIREKDGAIKFQGNVREINKRKKFERELGDANKLFTTLFTASPLAMVLVSVRTDFYVEANPAFAKMTGYSREEMVGRTAYQVGIVPKNVKEEMAGILHNKGKMQDQEMLYKTKWGETRIMTMIGEMIMVNDEKMRLYLCTDVTEQKKIEKALRDRDERFTKMFHNSPIAMNLSGVNPNKFLEVNRSFTELTGFTQEFVYGKHSAEIGLLDQKQREKLKMIFEKEGHLRNVEMVFKTPNGESKTLLLSSELIDIDDKKYSLSTYYDITTRKRLEKELITAKEIAEESSRAKEQFLANMSHEIRTPINGVIGFTELLEKTKLTKEQKEYVDAVSISGRNLLSVVNNILDYSKINSGVIDMEEIPLSIRSTFSSLAILFKQRSREKKLELSFTADSNIPEVVMGDPARLTQVFTNLVGNALKFTDKGFIKANAKLVSKNKKQVKIRFTVQDSGIGIAPNKLSSVFERFNQGSNDTNRKYGGTGLGLSIVKKLVELQSGKIQIKSKLGKGSIFDFTIVYKAGVAEQTKQASKKEILDFTKGKKLNILLVEDNLVNQKLAQRIISNFKYRSDIAENGKVAIAMLKKKKYDIVIMDMQMPIMDGYEATTVIRHKLKNEVPIIAMTAHALGSERDKCLRLGMNDYISKPFKAEALYESIQTVLKTKVEKASKKKAISKDKGVLNLDQLKDLSGDNKAFIAEMLGIFVSETSEDIKAIEKAIKKKDYATIKSLSHKQRSSLALVSADKAMAKVLANIEDSAAKGKDIKKIESVFEQYKQKINVALSEAKHEIKHNS